VKTEAWGGWALFGAAGLVSLIEVPPATLWARLFFVATVGAALVGAARLAGVRAQVVAAGVLLLLAVGERAIPRPLVDPPSSQWTVPLGTPDQMIRHTMRLPVGQPSWERTWQRAADAAVFVCARGPLAAEDGLQLLVNDQSLGTITQEQAIGPRPQPTSIGFYRIRVSREVLERAQPATFVLRHAPTTPEAARREVEICGTFTYRPTAGLDSSAFFDGVRWTSPGPTQQGRYLVELRIEDREGRAIAAIY
jgi:hypothetical protein